MTTGQIIKMLREERGMTQEQLAEQMGYSHKSSINKIELGKADLPQSKLIEFARILGVTPCELLGYESTPATEEQKKLWDEKLNANNKLQSEVQIIEAVQKQFGKDAVELLKLFNALNKAGKQKAVENLEDLASIAKYIEG
jgi:transcriptional regulator with XRE-family HTH domain